ncbi:GAD-like domain-containing protein [Brucella tritici]|nr:GAD-like domain-containing protein [Brucella tritici]
MLPQLFDELIGGRINQTTWLSDDALSSIGNVFPAPLVELYAQAGLCSIKGGRLQLCDPETLRGVLALVFGADKQFSHNNCHSFAFSSFGKIYCWSEVLAMVSVDMISGEVTSRGALGKIKAGAKIENQIYVPFSLSDDALDLDDEEGKPLFSRAAKKLGVLDIGECYGFFPAVALGGVRRIESLKRVSAPEHFAIIAQTLDFQLIDVQGYGRTKLVRAIG